ncbi:4-hydroxy-tetrahydrodipicolinate synthase [bacterium]|nr:4-hydroxy-tetrahydrodipicolinate synthase [bacterium]
MFNGCTVALITPFDVCGKIDYALLETLAELHLRAGTDGIVLAGCTGESFTLTDTERLEVYKIIKGIVGGRIKIILGTGASSTSVALSRTEAALEIGADGALVITPFGNKPSQSALINYFTEIAKVGLPIILYNVPGRTGTSIAPQTAIHLAEIENIVAIKEASGSLDTVSRILGSSEMTVLSGDDSLTLPMLSIGAKGVISTTANLFPFDFGEMVHSALDGDWAKAARIHLKMFPVMKALFIEGNPVPLKAAMVAEGIIKREDCRTPLAPLSDSNRRILLKTLEDYRI